MVNFPLGLRAFRLAHSPSVIIDSVHRRFLDGADLRVSLGGLCFSSKVVKHHRFADNKATTYLTPLVKREASSRVS